MPKKNDFVIVALTRLEAQALIRAASKSIFKAAESAAAKLDAGLAESVPKVNVVVQMCGGLLDNVEVFTREIDAAEYIFEAVKTSGQMPTLRPKTHPAKDSKKFWREFRIWLTAYTPDPNFEIRSYETELK